MGRKRIVISNCILEDLIYGRLKGPVISDAPSGMKITSVYSEIKKENFEHPPIEFLVCVEHPDFEEVAQFQELPILEIKFSQNYDPATEDLIDKLKTLEATFELESKTATMLRISHRILETHDAEKMHLVDDVIKLRREKINLEDKLNAILNVVKKFETE